MNSTQIEIESILQGYIEISSDGDVTVQIFDTFDFAYEDAKEITFVKVEEHKVDPNYGVQDEADICTTYSLSREDFMKDLGTLDITTIRFNGRVIAKKDIVFI